MVGDKILVRGVEVILNPYTEKRYKQFKAIQDEIDEYIAKHPDMTFDDVPASLKGKWWKAKGDILWRTANGVELDEAFYAHDEFELGTLKRVADFFLMNRLYL
jgi:hypothetical protein